MRVGQVGGVLPSLVAPPEDALDHFSRLIWINMTYVV
jgi:hypothetical protein